MGMTDLNRQLYKAVTKHDSSEVDRLLLAGADPNLKWSEEGDTVLNLSAYLKYTDIAGLLIEAGAGTEIRDNSGCTPLIKSVIAESPEMVKLLIDAGAKIDVKDKKGRTPLMAVLSDKCAKITKLLLDAGAKE